MKPRLPIVSGQEVIKALERGGFSVVGQEGSHIKMRRQAPEHTYTAIVPLHRELARKTLRSILRQGGLSLDEFKRLL